MYDSVQLQELKFLCKNHVALSFLQNKKCLPEISTYVINPKKYTAIYNVSFPL